MTMPWGSPKPSLLLLLALSLAVGCVESQPPVNLVQPNVTRKADIEDGEFYFLQTVVDTPYATDFTFVGEQGRMERIRWEIQEDYLVARRAYEAIAGADPEGINGTTDTAGAPLAIYAIEKHFDIRRQYNPVTGEELNVIEENTERPWWEREHMRVEWSQNLVENPDFLMLSRYFGGVEVSPVAWHVERGEENAPRFERMDPADEASPLGYMEVTNKMFVRPTTTDIPGLGPLPTCFLLQVIDGDPVDCAEGEITVRNAFVRVDPDHDYEPQVYTGDRMDRFGYFVTERAGYDPAYGLVEPARYRFVNRHNLWEASHRRDDAGAFVRCTDNAQCDDGRGSYCDLDFGRARRALTDDGRVEGACTIPFRDRVARPIAYHLSENFPPDLAPEMAMLEAEWSAAFVGTVASLREQECLAHGGSDCASERTRDDARQMFHVCASPVPDGAPAVCGEPGTVARIGDPRHNLLGWVNEPHRASPLGYGPSAADPITGEILSGNAFLYGAGLENVATFGTDIVRLLNGDLTEEDVASGAPVEAFLARMTDESRSAERAAHQHVIAVDGADAADLDAAMDFSWIRGGDRHARGASGSPGEMVERVRDSFARLSANRSLGDGVTTGATRLARLQGTEVEDMMTTREARIMAGVDPDLPVDDQVIEMASPLRAMRADRITALERARARFQEEAGLDWGDFADEGLLGLARAIQRAGESGDTITWHGVEYRIAGEDGQPDYVAVRDMLRHPILSGLALHEVGHTLGLRHNFSGSFDALNYQPRYWELRDDGTMRPRAWDPMTQAEHDGRITEYAYSTVMDYGHNFVVTDAQGIGHYDHAAIKMGYGDLVEVFESVPVPSEVAWASFIQSAGWPVSITFSAATGGELAAYTYTDWPRMIGGRDAMEARADVPYESLVTDSLLARSGIDHRVTDPDGRIAVPYRFCSDEQADLSPGCYRYDAGADAYESVQSVIDSYWNYYIFNNYRRQRLGFNVNGAARRIQGRYFEKLSRANQTYALYRGVFQDAFGDAPGYDRFFTREDGMGGYTLAVGAAYQLLLRVITAPEPGGYGMDTRGDGEPVMMPGGGDGSVDGFDGRYLETTWNFDAGYFWFDQLERVGYFYDKVLALQALTDPTTYFLGRDTDADIRRYQLNFASTFGPSMTRFFGGVLGEDWRSIAPRLEGEALVYPSPLQIEHGDMGGTPVSPNASFSIQLYAAVFGMALMPQTYDQQFLNRSRVWVQGGAEAIEVAEGTELVTLTDPDSGLTYVAARYPDADGVEQGVGARMLDRARALQARADEGDERAAGELTSFIDNLDLVRLLTWHLGFGAQP